MWGKMRNGVVVFQIVVGEQKKVWGKIPPPTIGAIFRNQLCGRARKYGLPENSTPPNRRWGAIFNRKFPNNVVFLSLGLLWGYEGVPSKTTSVGNTVGSCCLKTTLVVFVAENY